MEIEPIPKKRRQKSQKNSGNDNTGSIDPGKFGDQFFRIPLLAEDSCTSWMIREAAESENVLVVRQCRGAVPIYHAGQKLVAGTDLARYAFTGENGGIHHAFSRFDDGIQWNPFPRFNQNLGSGGNGNSSSFLIVSIFLQQVCCFGPNFCQSGNAFFERATANPPTDCPVGTGW